jgi:hypothetical protein
MHGRARTATVVRHQEVTIPYRVTLTLVTLTALLVGGASAGDAAGRPHWMRFHQADVRYPAGESAGSECSST